MQVKQSCKQHTARQKKKCGKIIEQHLQTDERKKKPTSQLKIINTAKMLIKIEEHEQK